MFFYRQGNAFATAFLSDVSIFENQINDIYRRENVPIEIIDNAVLDPCILSSKVPKSSSILIEFDSEYCGMLDGIVSAIVLGQMLRHNN